MNTEAETSACGVNCSVCKMHKLEKCYCISGIDQRADAKLKRQKEILGDVCKVLACAVTRQIAYCPRDCDDFPCPLFQNESRCFPYSQGFLEMIKFRAKKH